MPTPACRADGLGSFGALLAIALAALPGLPQAQPLPPAWEAREVFAPAGTQWTDVGDFNRHGAFVGMVRGDGVFPTGVLADPFGATQLLAPLAGDTHTDRLVLNDVGEVAGVSVSEFGYYRVFHRGSTGATSQLTAPMGFVTVRGVNDRGEVLLVDGSRGYVHDTRTGQIRSVGEALPIGAGSVGAYHINNRGVVSTLTVPSWIEGQEVPPTRGYLDDHGQLRFLGYGVSAVVLTDRGDVALSNRTVLLADGTRYTYDHGVDSRFVGMNERGQVVGFDHPSDPFCLSSRRGCGRAFLFEEGQTTFLDASFASQGHLPVGSRALDINEQGQILAMAWFAAGDRVTRVFLWSEGQVVDLTEQMASLTGLSRDYSISEASLNDAGQVLFRMTRAYNDPDLVFVLSPVPEPQVMAMLAAGLLVVGGLSRRRARASHWSND